MLTPQLRRIAALSFSLALLTSACGLKKGAYDALKQSNGAIGDVGGGLPTDNGTTGPSGQPTTGSSQGPGTGPIIGPGGSQGPGSSTGPGSGQGPGGGGNNVDLNNRAPCSAPVGDTTGITSTQIRIGVHAPQTGTGAPLPPSFQAGVNAYWKDHKICGRTVTVDFQDDKYTPATARAVCGPMSRRDFLIFGAAGTDQIQSCATMPDIAGKGVPYLSAGVTSNGLNGLSHYFAVSLTYEQQGALVVRNAIARGFGRPTAAGGKWAIVTGKSGNFDDATRGAQNALKAAGIPYDTYRVNQSTDNGLQQRAFDTGDKLAQIGYGVVYDVTSPGYFIYMAGKANGNAGSGGSVYYNPMYTGPGVTMTEVTVAQLVCKGTQNRIQANFLAPFPGIDRASADFKTATGNQYDDIYWALWGQAQFMEMALNAANRNLTRQNFIAQMQNLKANTSVFAPARFPGPANPGPHFGGTGAFSQDLSCTYKEPNQNDLGGWTTFGNRLDL